MTIPTRLIVALALTVFTLALGPAAIHAFGPAAAPEAAYAANGPGTRQVDLTKDMVKRFLAAYTELKALNEKEHPGMHSSKGDDTGITAIATLRDDANARSKMDAILESHGFDDFQAWLNTAQSVALAKAFAKSGQEPLDVDAQTSKAIERIQANPKMSADQKKQAIASFESQMAMIKSLQPHPGNVEIVKDMDEEISSVLSSDEN